jgi:hypothetical protein
MGIATRLHQISFVIQLTLIVIFALMGKSTFVPSLLALSALAQLYLIVLAKMNRVLLALKAMVKLSPDQFKTFTDLA